MDQSFATTGRSVFTPLTGGNANAEQHVAHTPNLNASKNSQFNVTHNSGLWKAPSANHSRQVTADSFLNGSQTLNWVENQTKLRMKIDKGRVMQNSFGCGHGFPIEGAQDDSTQRDTMYKWSNRKSKSIKKQLDPIGGCSNQFTGRSFSNKVG